MIDSSFLCLLKERVPLSSIIDKRVVLRKHGNRQLGLCPFHREKTPSFVVDDSKGFYHCFGCGVHGDIIDFLIRLDDLDFQDAVKHIADYAGILMPSSMKQDKKEHREHIIIGQINDFVARWFHDNLLSNKKVLEYLIAKRSVPKELIREFCLGYAPNDSSALIESLQQNFSAKLIVASGIANENMQCRFWDRIIFPITNSTGICIGFGGRVLNDKSIKTAKYINTIEGPLFKKSNILYGINLAKSVIKSTRMVYLVEGYLDVIAMRANGFANTIGCMGTSLSADLLQSLWAISDKVIMLMDSDNAGRSAVQRIVLDVVLPNLIIGKTVKIVTLSTGKDPDTVLKRNNGKLELNQAVNNALSLGDFIYSVLYRKFINKDSDFEDYAALRNAFKKYSNIVVNRELGYELHQQLRNNLFHHRRFGYHKMVSETLKIDDSVMILEALHVLLYKYPEILRNNDLEDKVSYVLNKLLFKDCVFSVEFDNAEELVHNALNVALDNIALEQKFFSWKLVKQIYNFDISVQDAYIDYFILITLVVMITEEKIMLDIIVNETACNNVEEKWQYYKGSRGVLRAHIDEALKICLRLGLGVL
ncbi:DNA primase [Candidatus Xenohaliotis californiensis]|uniref:DNA primase n=1 Tax=Candidatus Xenohaliotis californiensis TaxID=84677 RepID=A0ABP0EUM2_9RICK|nr:DNA primase [Candidatus Xenohaliotis californiensis]